MRSIIKFYNTIKSIYSFLIENSNDPFFQGKRNSKFKNYFKINKIQIGSNIIITGIENIHVKENFTISSGCKIYSHSGKLTIGENFSTNNNVFIGASEGEIVIGNNVIIGPNTVLRAGDHEFKDVSIPIRDQGHKKGKITIEDDVWIGANVTILRDVNISKGCIIAAGAVLNKSTEPYSIYGGVPAKLLKKR
jgi:galactoside O-acetyltransferase